MQTQPIGIVGYGLYIPETFLSAEQIADATEGTWAAQAVRHKLGFDRKPVPGPRDGTQEMGVKAAIDALRRTEVDPQQIDLILCIGEEYKEYPLTTSGIYVQEQIGAHNAWSIDVQQRCNSTIAALKIAKNMMSADDEIETVLIVGGYRNGDLVDLRDSNVSFMYNLGAGAGALIVRKGHPHNHLLGTHIITDGSMARDVGVYYGGTEHPVEKAPDDELARMRREGNRTLRVFDPEHMKARLNEVSLSNWLTCLDRALEKSGYTRSDIGYLNVLHFKPSMHHMLCEELGLSAEQTVYLSDYGHLGQVDQMVSIHEGERHQRLRDGDVMVMISAGIGYVWGAAVVRWG